MKQKTSTRKMTAAALFAALTCVSTIAIRIPTPGTGGYIHPGDAFVIISGIFLGPAWGALAAGIGSALADVLGGYFIYAPITLVIKGLIALLTGLVTVALRKRNIKKYWSVPVGGIVDIVLVAGGYFVCEIPMYGLAAALLSVPANAVQGVSGLVIALILYPVLSRHATRLLD